MLMIMMMISVYLSDIRYRMSIGHKKNTVLKTLFTRIYLMGKLKCEGHSETLYFDQCITPEATVCQHMLCYQLKLLFTNYGRKIQK